MNLYSIILATFAETILETQNVFFLCAFIFALIFLVLQFLGVMGDADVDGDVEVDGDAEVELDGLSKVLSLFGIGKAPIGIWLFIFFFMFGMTGLVSNLILFENSTAAPKNYFLFTLTGAFFLALLLSRLFSGIVARLLPKNSSHSINSPYDLLRHKGKVRFGIGENKSGSIHVIDSFGNMHNVQCIIDPSIKEKVKTIPSGTEVKITDYIETVSYTHLTLPTTPYV